MDSHRFIIASAERRRAAGNRSGSAGATSSCAARGSTAIRAAGERAAGINHPGYRSAQPAARVPVSVDQVVDQIIAREHALINFLKNRTPLVETYFTEPRARQQGGRGAERRPLFPGPSGYGRNR